MFELFKKIKSTQSNYSSFLEEIANSGDMFLVYSIFSENGILNKEIKTKMRMDLISIVQDFDFKQPQESNSQSENIPKEDFV